MGRDRKTSPDDDYDVDDTVERQMSTSGMTDVVKQLSEKTGENDTKSKKTEDDES